MVAILILSYPKTHPRIRVLEGNQINNLDSTFDAQRIYAYNLHVQNPQRFKIAMLLFKLAMTDA